MDRKELIDMLNRDFADEHAAILRYLIHAYQEGEDTPMGAGLLSRSREEMWHMHWLGMIIGQLGGEPNFVPGPYPFDPTSRATMLKSYIEYEEKLIPHYHGEAEKVDDPHIQRVLHREAWESAIHARRFQRLLDKLSPEAAKGLPQGGGELPPAFLETLQAELNSKYNEMLQHLRLSWHSQKDGGKGWALMDQSMEKMKQLALFAEAVAEDGPLPRMIPGGMDAGLPLEQILRKALGDVREALGRHAKLQEDGEFKKHSGLVMKMDLTVQQEAYQAEEMNDWLK
ncbi:MAG: Ferritin-like domain protein [Syntrophus sp. PtaU1.Bin208]|nr:MAG: Ferritin-like domain protein [Syntrophus sp. PtaU1.Bin208]